MGWRQICTLTMKKPELVEKYWYSIDWDVKKLWLLDLPVVEVSMEVLVWHLEVAIWPDNHGKPYTVTPRQVLEEPARYPKEYQRIIGASLEYPLEIYQNKSKVMILDGVHRLAKAWQGGQEKIKSRWIPEAGIIRLKE